MRRVLFLSCALLSSASFAQYPDDDFTPFAVSGAVGDQIQPKVRSNNHSQWVSWFDNRVSGYDVYVQALNDQGVPQLTPDGVLVADRNFSSTVDYDLAVDNQGRAVVIFNDDRPGSNQITVQRIRPDGTMDFGTGLVLSSGTASKNNPKVCVLADNSLAVGWTEGATPIIKRVSEAGAILPGQATIAETSRNLVLSDLETSADNQILAMWMRPGGTGITAAKWLASQKYNLSLVPQWSTAVGSTTFFGGTNAYSIQIGYFPTIEPDDVGGFVCAWYTTSTPRNAYLQHVLSNGTVRFVTHGLPCFSVAPRIVLSASASYDRFNDEYYVVGYETDSGTQSVNAIKAQRVIPPLYSRPASLAWGNSGVTVIGNNSNQPSFLRAETSGEGMYIGGFDSRSATTGVVMQAGIARDGIERFGITNPSFVYSIAEAKGRYDICTDDSGGHISVYQNGATGGSTNVHAGLSDGYGILGVKPNTITGTLNYPGFMGNMNLLKLNVTVSNNTGTENYTVKVNNGQFTIKTFLVGAVTVKVEERRSLRASYNTTSPGTVSASLLAGDIDQDGEVGSNDFDIVVADYGDTAANDPLALIFGDLDGDGEIGSGDFDLVVQNYGLIDQ